MTADTKTPGRLDDILSDDRRWYVFGDERFIRVSTVLEHADKEGLRRWSAQLAAGAAIDDLPRLITATRTKACGNTWKRCQHDYRQRCSDCPCHACLPCVRKWMENRHYGEAARRADEGTRVHDVIEHWVLNGGDLISYEPDIAVYVDQFLTWVKDYGLTPDSWEMSEATVINRTHGYAGTLDTILRIHADATELAAKHVASVLGLPVSQVRGRSVSNIVDAKTREKEEAKLYPEHALQQTPYKRAEVVRLRDGREFPMPQTDAAVILQLRPDGYLFRPVVTDDETFAAFLSLLSFARWHMEFATASVSSRTFKVPAEPKPAKAAKTVAPAKRAPAKKAAPRKRLTTKLEDVPEPGRTPETRPTSAILASVARRHTPAMSPAGDEIPF